MNQRRICFVDSIMPIYPEEVNNVGEVQPYRYDVRLKDINR